jgi:hypothetical protein
VTHAGHVAERSSLHRSVVRKVSDEKIAVRDA